jgi:predicted Fe-Mo cluster-binding NifX family protein
MDKIRICIGSNDGMNLGKSHLGDVDFFYIYDLYSDSKRFFIDKKTNSAKKMEHAKGNKMQSVLKIIGDVNILVAFQMSHNFKNIASETMFQPVVVKREKLEDVLEILSENYNFLIELINQRKLGKITTEIPVLQ